MPYTSGGGRGSRSTSRSTLGKALASSAKRKAKQKDSGDGGILGSLKSLVSKAVPEIGVGNTAKMLTSIPTGVGYLASAIAPGGVPIGEGLGNFGKGLLYSFQNTAATAAKPFGGDIWYEPSVGALNRLAFGEKAPNPRDFIERAYDPNVGVIPAAVEDIGNVAMGGAAVARAAKIGTLGKLAAPEALSDIAETGGATARLARATAKWTQRAAKAENKIGPEAASLLRDSPAFARRVSAIKAGEYAAHPYETLGKALATRFTQPAQAAEAIVGARRGAQAAEAAGEAKPLYGVGQIGEDRALTDVAEQARLAEADIRAGRAAAPRGEPQAAPLLNDLGEPVTPIRAKVGPVEEAGILNRAQPPNPKMLERGIKAIEEGGAGQRIVRALAATQGRVDARLVKTVAREGVRFIEAARRAERNEPWYQQAVSLARDNLVNKIHPETGARISAAQADNMIGSEVIARMTGAEMARRAARDALGEGWNPAEFDKVLNDIKAKTSTIPPELLTPEISQQLDDVAAQYAVRSQTRLGTLVGDRLGAQGLENALSDTPVMTKTEQKAYTKIKRAARHAQTIGARKASRSRTRVVKEAAAIQAEIDVEGKDIERLNLEADALDHQSEALLTYTPPLLREERRQTFFREVVRETLAEDGATADPSAELAKAFDRSGGWTTSMLPETVRRVSLANFDETALEEVYQANRNFLTDPDAKLGTWVHTLQPDQITEGDRAAGLKVGDSVVDIDFSQDTLAGAPLKRWQALVLGQARRQIAVYSPTGADLYLPRSDEAAAIASVFRPLVRNPNSQFNRAMQSLYEIPAKLGKEKGNTAGVKILMDEIDATMQVAMNQAIFSSRAAGKGLDGVDSFFGEWRAAVNYNPERVLANHPTALAQVILNEAPTRATFEKARKTFPQWEHLAKWYTRSHDYVEETFRPMGDVTLLNGTQINMADLMYQLLAVTSVNSTPLTNLGNALSSIRNLRVALSRADSDMQRVLKITRDWRLSGSDDPRVLIERLFPEKRGYEVGPGNRAREVVTPAGATNEAPTVRAIGYRPKEVDDFIARQTKKYRAQGDTAKVASAKAQKDAAGYGTGIYQSGMVPRAVYMILSGRGMETWDKSFLETVNGLFGGGEKKLSTKNIPQATMAQARADLEAVASGTGEEFWRNALENLQGRNQPGFGAFSYPLDTWLALPDGAMMNRGRSFHTLDGVVQRAIPEVLDAWDENGPTATFADDVDGIIEQARQQAREADTTRVSYDGTTMRDVWNQYADHVEGLKNLVESTKRKGFSPVTDEAVQTRAAMLYHGDAAWAKLQSFYENLRDPANSRAVTLDAWMARLFGVDSWSKTDAYAEVSRKIGQLADDLNMKPHEVQALLWAYGKHRVSRGEVGRLAGGAWDAFDAAEKDPAFRFGTSADPLAQMLQEDLDLSLANLKAGGGRRPISRTARIAEPGVTPEGFDYAKPLQERPKIRTEQQRWVVASDKKAMARVQDSYDEYRAAARTANEQLAAGNFDGARETILSWARERSRSVTQHSASGFDEAKDNPRIAQGMADLMGVDSETLVSRLDNLGLDGDTLAQSLRGEILGAVVREPSKSVNYMLRVFPNADFTTLMHEGAHLLRKVLPAEDVKRIEQWLGVKFSSASVAEWRRAEEKFADAFMKYLYTKDAPTANVAAAFDRTKQVMEHSWEAWRDTDAATMEMSDEMYQFFDDVLNPQVEAIPEEFAPFRQAATGSARRNIIETPVHPGESAAAAKVRTYRATRAADDAELARLKIREKEVRVARLEKKKGKLGTVLKAHSTPGELELARKNRNIERMIERLAKSLQDPTTGSVPAKWQPLWDAFKRLTREAQTNPALELPDEWVDNFASMMEVAARNGFDPTHVRSFTPKQVESLMYGHMRLGQSFKGAGEEIAAGTRAARTRPHAVTQSVSALAAAMVEAVHESQSNHLADFIEQNLAKRVVGGYIPDGWSAWDPVRRFITTGEKVEKGGKIVETIGAPPTMMVPNAVASTVRNMGRDYTHWSFKALGKIQDPWRALVLVLTPRWYVNNFVGNLILSTAAGASVGDWLRAWHEYRQREFVGEDLAGKGIKDLASGAVRDIKQLKKGRKAQPFSDIPGVTGASIYSDLTDPHTLAVPGGIREKLRYIAGTKDRSRISTGYRMAMAKLSRSNEVVDEMARAAVYFSSVRKGATAEQALMHSYEALVDYGDLSQIERQMVRAVVPFYAWQKGILKLVVRAGIEHPAAASVVMQLDRISQEWLQDKYGTMLPPGYAGLIPYGKSAINTRGFNPFADAAALVTAQGIARSMNPFAEEALRAELGAPEGGIVKAQRVNEFGRLVPDVNVAQGLEENVAGALPQIQLGQRLTGTSPSPYQESTQRSIGRFLGVPGMSQEEVARLVERTAQSRATLSGQRLAGSRRSGSTLPRGLRSRLATAAKARSTARSKRYTRSG